MTKVKKEVEDNFQKVTKNFPATRFLAIAFTFYAEFINDKLVAIVTEICVAATVISLALSIFHLVDFT